VNRVWQVAVAVSISAAELISAPALAQGEPQAEPEPELELRAAAAAAAYQRALTDYRKGDVAGALAGMYESYRISQRKTLLYNVAQLERELGHCPEALTNYRGYLDGTSNGSYRAEAEKAILELQAECPDPAKASSESPPGPRLASISTPLVARPSADLYWSAPRILGWSAIAAGALAGGAALEFTLAAKAARDEVQTSVDVQVQGGPHWDEQRQRDQHRDQTWAQVFGFGAGTLITGGVLLVLLDPGRERAPSGNVSLSFQQGGAQACYLGAF
jgi:hypothetical protein